MKHIHWDFTDHVRSFDSGELSTFAILGAAIVLILLVIANLFFSTPLQSDVLLFPGV
jgi:hypothetical protein